MADLPEIPQSARIAAYVNRLIAGDFDGKTKQEIADILDIDRRTLWDWNKKVDWASITTEKRKLYAQDILDIDQAAIREAKKGNVAAIEFCHRRFDGWNPTTAQISLNAPDDELKAEAAKIRAEQEAKNGQNGPDIPGAGAAQPT